MAQNTLDLAGEVIYLCNSVNFVAEKLYTDSRAAAACRKNLDSVAADSEFIADKINIVSLILNLDKFVYKLISVLCIP